jgi:voltage-gated potassium channel
MSSRLARAAAYLLAVFVGGTVGYRVIERADWWDAFYMTAITLTTVGYREVFPLSRAGQVFTVVLLVFGLGLLLLVATEIGRTVLEGEIRHVLGQARRSRMIERLEGHEIVCGWGRMGQAVVEELRHARRDVVVVELRGEKVQRLNELGIAVVAADATSETALNAAGVARARGLVACLNDDAHNVYTVLTARSLNPNLFIVARAGEEGAETRMRRAGANRVVNPYQHGGTRLAHLLLKPSVVDFLDFSLAAGREAGLDLEQLRVDESSVVAGRTIIQADLRRRCGIAVVAVRRAEALLPNPEPSLRIEAGDVLIVLGTRGQLESLERLMCSQHQLGGA